MTDEARKLNKVPRPNTPRYDDLFGRRRVDRDLSFRFNDRMESAYTKAINQVVQKYDDEVEAIYQAEASRILSEYLAHVRSQLDGMVAILGFKDMAELAEWLNPLVS